MISLPDIQQKIHGEIRVHEALAPLTPFGIGGPADYLVRPAGKNDLTTALTYFQQQDIDVVLMRSGSPIVISDQGFRGACFLIDTALGELSREGGGTVRAGAAVRLTALTDYCVSSGLAGAERWAGVEVTTAEALVAGPEHGAENFSSFVENVDVWSAGIESTVSLEEFDRRYRNESDERPVILSVHLRFQPGEKDDLMRSRREFLIERNRFRPVNIARGGIVFRDPPGKRAAELLERAGMKGKKRGGAMISREHANVFYNTGGAKAQDFLRLILDAQQAVRRQSGVNLELEIALLGFAATVLQEVA
jgi:UDP-N-acetylmuramate dehydrogenase